MIYSSGGLFIKRGLMFSAALGLPYLLDGKKPHHEGRTVRCKSTGIFAQQLSNNRGNYG